MNWFRRKFKKEAWERGLSSFRIVKKVDREGNVYYDVEKKPTYSREWDIVIENPYSDRPTYANYLTEREADEVFNRVVDKERKLHKNIWESEIVSKEITKVSGK